MNRIEVSSLFDLLTHTKKDFLAKRERKKQKMTSYEYEDAGDFDNHNNNSPNNSSTNRPPPLQPAALTRSDGDGMYVAVGPSAFSRPTNSNNNSSNNRPRSKQQTNDQPALEAPRVQNTRFVTRLQVDEI